MSQSPLTTIIPTTLDPAAKAKATSLLDHFGKWATGYVHGDENPYIRQLEAVSTVAQDRAIEFLNAWWGFSYMTPRVLLRVAACFEDRDERAFVMSNYIEEDGFAKEGDDTHHVLLQGLIESMGGTPKCVPWAEHMVRAEFFDLTKDMAPAYAAGVLSAFEHPALDITRLIALVVEKSGHSSLLTTDPYLLIHDVVEPSHIIWAHQASLRWCETGYEEKVKQGFQMVMRFWVRFWSRAVAGLQLED